MMMVLLLLLLGLFSIPLALGKNLLVGDATPVGQNAFHQLQLQVERLATVLDKEKGNRHKLEKQLEKILKSVEKGDPILTIGQQIQMESSSLLPVGSIIPWIGSTKGLDLPSGWQRCDGRVIEQGPMKGTNTPDLNNSGRFLRGGPDSEAGSTQEDSIMDHHHLDPGHTHQEKGHTHSDLGHRHQQDPTGSDFPGFVGAHSCAERETQLYYDIGQGGGMFWCVNSMWETYSGAANISSAKVDISPSFSGIGGVSSEKSGKETRPKNMKVVFIIKTI